MFNKPRDHSIPRNGDTLVTLRCQKDRPLEERMELLSYAFAKLVQGAILRQVVKWDLRNGEIKFIVGEGPALPPPRGTLVTILDNYATDGVEAKAVPVEHA